MLAHLLKPFRPCPEKQRAHLCYAALAEQARRPAFYGARGAPDTLDGRFEMLALHLFFVLHRLRALPETRDFQRALTEVFFADMDRALRELGVGDLGVGRRVQRMAEGFYGRLKAYEAGLDSGTLETAIARNCLGTAPDSDAAPLAAYAEASVARLAETPIEETLAARIAWPTLGR